MPSVCLSVCLMTALPRLLPAEKEQLSTRNPSLRSGEKYHERRGRGQPGWGKIKGQGSDKDEETDKQSKRKKKGRDG